MAIKFKGQPTITKLGDIKRNVWYQCSSAMFGIKKPFLLQKISVNSFFIIFNDETTGIFKSNSTIFDKDFVAFPVKLNIEVV